MTGRIRRDTRKGLWIPHKEFARRFERRVTLIEPYIRKYGDPVLVHATNDLKSFAAILREGSLRLPSEHGKPTKCPYLSRDLKIENVIYLSLGFVYATSYNCRYNLVFDLRTVKECIYYRGAVSYLCYWAVARYWERHDSAYLDKLAGKNAECAAVVRKFRTEEYAGKALRMLDFWRIEQELYEAIQRYPRRRVLVAIIRAVANDLRSTYAYAKVHARKSYRTDKTPEILATRAIDLRANPYFLGVYVEGPIPESIKRLLRQEYPTKSIFDGKRMIPASQA